MRDPAPLLARIATLNESPSLREATRLKASRYSVESGSDAVAKHWEVTDCPYIREDRDGWLLGYGLASGLIVEK